MSDIKDSYTLEALLTGDNSRLKRVIDQAVVMLEKLENKKVDDIEFDGDVKPLRKKVESAKRLTEMLDGKRAQIEIIARNAEAIKNLRQVRLSAKRLSKERPKIDVDVQTGAANANIKRFKAMLKSIPNKVRTRVDVDYDRNVFKRITSGWRQIQNANNKFGDDMDQLANSIRAFGTVSANMIKGSLVSSFTALIPIVAALVPAIMAVGNAIAVVGGGALGLAGAFAVAGGGVASFGALAISAYKMYKDGAIQASDATQKFESSLNSFKSEWESLAQKNADSIFSTMANGINIAKTALTGLTPFITGVTKSMEGLSASVLKWSQTSAIAKSFFDVMKTSGVTVFQDIMSAAGKFGSGLISLFTSFMPLFEWVAKGFSNMGTQFNNWSQKVSTAEGIKNFIDYTKTNLPLIGQIFSNTFMGLFNLFKAFGSNSQTIFESLTQMTAKFREWSETVGQSEGFKSFVEYVQTNGPTIMNLIGAIATALVNFGVAIAPIGQKVLEVVTAFAQWLSTLFQTNPVVAQIVAVLITLLGVGMQLAPVIMFLVRTFQFLIVPLGQLMGVSTLASTAIKLLGIAFTFLTGPVGIAIAAITALVAGLIYLWNTNDTFRNAFIVGWEMTKAAFVAAIEIIKQTLITGFTTMITVALQIFSGLQTGISAIWSTVSAVFSASVNLIISVVSSGFSSVLSFITSTMSSISNFVSSTWSSIVSSIGSFINSAVSIVSSGFSNILSVVSSAMSNILSAVISAFASIVSSISSGISTAVSIVTSGFGNMISAVVSFASNLVSSITSAMSNFVSAISSGASQAVTAIQTMISNIISAVTGAAADMVSAGVNLVNGFISGIQSMAGAAVAAAADMASNAVSTVKSMLKIASPSRVFKKIGKWTSEGFAIGIMKKVPQVIQASKNMANSAVKALSKMKTNSYDKAKQGSKSFYESLSKTSQSASNKLSANNKKIASIQQKLKGKIWKSTRSRLNKQLIDLRKENKAYTVQKNTITKLRSTLSKSTNQLLSIANKREKVADKLKVAQDNLKQVLKDRQNFKDGIIDSTRSFGSISNSKVSTQQGLVADMRARLKAVNDYAKNINALKKKGVHKNIIADLLSAGVEGGAGQAKILANASKNTIKQINTVQKQIMSVTSSLAERQAKDFYTVGLNTAKGIVKGLQKQDKALQKAAERIANTITNTVKKKLGIHSPSRVFKALGIYTMQGFIGGIDKLRTQSINKMANLSERVSEAFTPRFVSGLPDLTGNLRNATANIASQVNADVVNTVRSEPVGVTLNANFALGNRDYNAFVGDITDKQNSRVRLQETYKV